jgi:L-aspartate oxidase
MSQTVKFDYLVIGSGLAGLTYALEAAKKGRVAVVTKSDLNESNTAYAQGGIAAVTADDDSFELHIEDTLRAGQGLCREDAVRLLVENGPAAIRQLIEFGTRFTRAEAGYAGKLDLHREGGHSKRRIVHAADLTGREIGRALSETALAEPNITVFEQHTAIDLVLKSKMENDNGAEERVAGAFVLSPAGDVKTFISPVTFLAAGGCGKVYLYTSNPDISSGDGIAMAYRAGARVVNMEFMQFHPTCLYHPQAKSFLISEAVRGEGGLLKLMDGSTFMENYDSRGCLAPRDIVARAIDTQMKKRGDDHVYLDVTNLGEQKLREKFPNIYETLKKYGFDMASEMIPVVPAAHYMCGGIDVDLWGRSSVAGLYAGGENGCNGVHGANRLASNSLLEAIVFSRRAARKSGEEWEPREVSMKRPWTSGGAVDSDEQVVITQNWDEIRQLMWNYVGIVRSDKRLSRAKKRMEILKKEIREYYRDFTVTSDLIELRNIATCAELIIESAARRNESRGLHYNLDHPETDKGTPKEISLTRGESVI